MARHWDTPTWAHRLLIGAVTLGIFAFSLWAAFTLMRSLTGLHVGHVVAGVATLTTVYLVGWIVDEVLYDEQGLLPWEGEPDS